MTMPSPRIPALRKLATFALGLAALLTSACGQSSPAPGARLDAIKESGVLRVAAFDGNPPFGSINPETRQIEGLDVDYARAIADALGVKLELVPTNPANRIPLLSSGKADLILANFTITPERAQQVDFSIPYFASGQQFIAKRGTLTSPDQLAKLRIGVDKGTVNEINLRNLYPGATQVAFDDTPFAFTALRNGNVQAITQDGPKLIGILANAPDADQYEIPDFTISQDLIGIGISKGEASLKQVVDDTLRQLETSGEAQRIHDRWFGPATKTPLPRNFRIGDTPAAAPTPTPSPAPAPAASGN